jgi:hypothetical protein
VPGTAQRIIMNARDSAEPISFCNEDIGIHNSASHPVIFISLNLCAVKVYEAIKVANA